MDAIHFDEAGSAEVLKIVPWDMPLIKDDEVLVKIVATSVNEIDIYRRLVIKVAENLNPILGMECPGTITSVGSQVEEVSDWKVGDNVCALLSGGGYAQFVAVPYFRVMPIPMGIAITEATSLPYAGCVVWHSLFRKGKLPENCSIMIHDGVGDFGPLAIELGVDHGCTVFATAWKAEFDFCRSLGARHCFEYNNFVEPVLNITNGRGVDFVFDPSGGGVSGNIEILAKRGTLVLAGGDPSEKDNMDFEAIAMRQLKLIGVNILSLDSEEKTEVMRDLVKNVWPKFVNGKITTHTNKKRYKFKEAAKAHEAVEFHTNRGKILLIP